MARSIRRVTLRDVGRKAYRDQEFFEQLRRARDPQKVLTAAGISLSDKDIRGLRRALASSTVLLRVDARRLLALAHKQHQHHYFPDDWGPWPGSWDRIR